ncbi:MAG TPA: EAL domain-containing protein [Frankiaceae bacterium]|nr:EAL domain-containing protein [Frankiaceae bacterium]
MRNLPSALRWIRRLSLSARFGLLSAALVALLGVALGSWSADRIRRSNVDEAVRLIGYTNATTLYTLSHLGKADLPHSQDIRTDLGNLMIDASIHSRRLVGLIVWNASRRVVYASSPLTNMEIHPPEGLASAFAGQTHTRLISSADADAYPGLHAIIARSGPVLQIVSPDATGAGSLHTALQSLVPWRPVESNIRHQTILMSAALLGGLFVFWLALFRLVTRASRRLREQADRNHNLANHDPLTGLPNRELLRRRTLAAIRRSNRTGRRVALLLLDLDRFKEINDTLGHHHGDLLLQEIGPRLASVMREGDCIARLGGDEFVVLLPDVADAVHAQTLGRRIRAELAAPFVLEGVSLDVEASVGIAVTPEHGTDFSTLLQHADVAMYVAKKAHLGLSVYDRVLDDHSPLRLALISELRAALADPGQFVLHYQPKLDMKTGKLSGFEALVRWQHPERGLLVPDEFIPDAERTGMIRTLTDLVLSEAVRQVNVWKQAGVKLPVAVNLSTRCLLDPQFPDDVGALLDAHGVAGSELVLEITESAIMADPERAHEILSRLVALGVGISIDDFGTGYSSMAHLKRLPIDQIKIDKSFVIDLVDNPNDAAIVRSMVDLARGLGLGVVAEGVETAETWNHLQDLGCTSAQGFYLSRPLPADDVLPWVATYRARTAIPAARAGTGQR